MQVGDNITSGSWKIGVWSEYQIMFLSLPSHLGLKWVMTIDTWLWTQISGNKEMRWIAVNHMGNSRVKWMALPNDWRLQWNMIISRARAKPTKRKKTCLHKFEHSSYRFGYAGSRCHTHASHADPRNHGETPSRSGPRGTRPEAKSGHGAPAAQTTWSCGCWALPCYLISGIPWNLWPPWVF